MGRYLSPGVLGWPEGIVLEASNSAPLQLGHRHKRTRVSAAISLCLPFAPRYEEWQRSASAKDTPCFGERMSLFRVTKSTGGLLALVKASDPPSALEAYARMRGHLSFARLASACGLAFADAQKAFVTQEVGSAQPC